MGCGLMLASVMPFLSVFFRLRFGNIIIQSVKKSQKFSNLLLAKH